MIIVLGALNKSIKLFLDTIFTSTIRYSIQSLDMVIFAISGHKGGKERSQSCREASGSGRRRAKIHEKGENNKQLRGRRSKKRAIKRGSRRKGQKEINKVGAQNRTQNTKCTVIKFCKQLT